jgi:carboxylesterase type B
MNPVVTSTSTSTSTVTGGLVRGQVQDDVARYSGVPYAAAPTGPLRFRAPAPVIPWEGVREADRFGATPPKPSYRRAVRHAPERPIELMRHRAEPNFCQKRT